MSLSIDDPNVPIYGRTRYGRFRGPGGRFPFNDPYEHPWRVNNIRVDFMAQESLAPVQPGETATYRCAVDPVPFEYVTDHEQRYQSLKSLLHNVRNVLTYPTPTAIYFRQRAGADQLVRIEPLATGYDATAEDGVDPPTRESPWEGRWAVVTGGQDLSRTPDAYATVELETVTIATTEEFPTRDGLVAARERTGF